LGSEETQKVIDSVPLRRLEPEEVENAYAIWLRNMQLYAGHMLVLDGGWSLERKLLLRK
jgi:hypothetical protein